MKGRKKVGKGNMQRAEEFWCSKKVLGLQGVVKKRTCLWEKKQREDKKWF